MKHFCIVWVFLCCMSLLPVSGFSYDSEHYSVLQQGVKSWNAMRVREPETRFDLSGANMKGKNLKGIDFSHMNLTGALLDGSDLSEADLRGAVLDNAVFKNTLLYEALLRDASLRDADLEEAGLDGADMRGVVLDGAVLRQADLAGSLLRDASLRGTDLRAANLRMADLGGVNLDGAYLWRAVLDGANLEGAVVTHVTIVETGSFADQAWAEKKGASLTIPEHDNSGAIAVEKEAAGQQKSAEKMLAEKEETLKGDPDTATVYLEKSWPINPVQQKIRFGVTRDKVETLMYDVHQRELLVDNVSRWNKMRKESPEKPIRLAEATLSRKMLDGADLRNADLSGALLKRTDLVEADMRGANLRGANLREADLTNADLRGADLRGAYLWRANLSWTMWEGAIVDAQTVLGTGKKATPEWARKSGALYRLGD